MPSAPIWPVTVRPVFSVKSLSLRLDNSSYRPEDVLGPARFAHLVELDI
jgi:hypothetical protein